MPSDVKFYNFHQHSHYSVNDCTILVPKYVEECKNRGLNSAFISDHGTLGCCYELYNECKKHNIKPILGIESYFVPNYIDEVYKEPYNYGHIVLIARNRKGWENIKKLQSIAWHEGHIKKPRISLELLRKYNEGIIITTGCLDGIIGYNLFNRQKYEDSLTDDRKILDANNLVEIMQTTFVNRIYGEIQLNDVDIQTELNKQCVNICNKLNIPIIVTGDTHYINEDDTVLHDIIICIKWHDKLNDPDNHIYTTKQLWMKSIDEIYAGKNKFHNYISDEDLTTYINNTKTLNDSIEEYNIMPNVSSTPKFDTGNMTNLQYIIDLCSQHILYKKVETNKHYMARFARELQLIRKKNFIDYFLIIHDICKEAMNRNMPYNSRGSVCGSLVAHLLNITWIDPIRFNTPFERFLSEDRQNMPDIDLDFSRTGRDKMIQYLRDKYGDKCVAQICNYSIYKPKVAFKDACRVFDIPYQIANRITKKLKLNVKWEDFFKDDEIVEFFQENEDVYKYTEKLLGIIRQYGIHASGVLLTPGDVSNWAPVAYQKGTRITEWDGSMLEHANLLKIDFLGLNMLDIVDTAIQLIDKSGKMHDPIKNLHSLFKMVLSDLDNERVYKFISSGKNIGTFQLGGSSGMMALAKQLRPNNFSDVMALISLYRTAILQMGADQDYVKRKHGKPFDYIHNKMQSALHDTYGILLYQFQTCQIAHDLAGFTMLEADHFRNGIKKKDRKKLKIWKDKFIDGCKLHSDIEKNKAEEIWEYIEAFSSYGFNRSHAASYGLLGFTTAWLKYYYPNEYMTSLLRHNVDDDEQLYEYMLDCARMKIKIIKPDINKSSDKFELKNNDIYTPLNFIKGLGKKALVNIIENRTEFGLYKSFDDFLERVDRRVVNISVLMKLILSDAFAFEIDKEQLFDTFMTSDKMQKDKIVRQLFCTSCDYRYVVRHDDKKKDRKELFCPSCNSPDITCEKDQCVGRMFNDNLLNEDLYGFNIWNDNLGKYIPGLEKQGYKKLSDLENWDNGNDVKIIFEIKKIKTHIDKNDNQMAFLEVSDNIVSYDLIMFADAWSSKKDYIKKNTLYVGKLKKDGEKLLMYQSHCKEFKMVELIKKD